jgi:hypothetical protein
MQNVQRRKSPKLTAVARRKADSVLEQLQPAGISCLLQTIVLCEEDPLNEITGTPQGY